MNVTDKIKTSAFSEEREQRYCPPHRTPHTLPLIGKKVIDEHCHIHITTWRYYLHHLPYCLLIDCPNAKAMMLAQREYIKSLKDLKNS